MKISLLQTCKYGYLILSAYMYNNLKLECPWTMSKTNGIKPLYHFITVYISSLQTLYKLLCDNKLM